MLASSGALAACASILGIDDGLVRQDGGPSDAAPDVVAVDSGDEAGNDATPDAGLDARVDAPPPYSPLGCGKGTCNAVTQGCCREGNGSGASPYTYVCVSDAAACTSGSAIVVPCDRAANCVAQGKPGTVCCANTFNTRATAVACVAPAACPVDAATLVCGPGDDELCAAHGWACLPSIDTITGWDICK